MADVQHRRWRPQCPMGDAYMIDVSALMKKLSAERPVFHSEADFQHAFAWALHKQHPEFSLRLEFPIEVQGRLIHIDIWASRPGAACAIELKYKTRVLTARINQEAFHLKDQAAQDLARYDLMKDIWRLEQLASPAQDTTGLAVFLSNDNAYWKRSDIPTSADAAFRIHEAREVGGSLQWGVRASQGTTKGREEAIDLRATYRLSWNDYSRVASSSYDTFRYLALSVVA